MKNERLNLKKLFLYLFILFVVFPPIAFLVLIQIDSYIDKHYEPVNPGTCISGYVKRVNQDHGVTLFRMINGKKFRTKAIYMDINGKYEFGEQLKSYDSLYKAAYSDTIFLFRSYESKIYVFKELSEFPD
jgi:hypothetical protein